MQKLFVGNLPYSATVDDLARAFAAVGTVEEVQIAKDRETQRSRGFAFVTMTSDADAARAVEQLNGAPFGGRALTVTPAKPREPRNGNGFHNRKSDRGREHRGGREPRW